MAFGLESSAFRVSVSVRGTACVRVHLGVGVGVGLGLGLVFVLVESKFRVGRRVRIAFRVTTECN